MKTIFIIIALLSIATMGQYNRYSVPEKKDILIPKGYYLDSYYSHPFSPVTWTYFGLPDSCSIRMTISDSSNTVILDTLFIGRLDPGNYKYDFGHFLQKNKKPGEVVIFVINIDTFEERNGFGTVSSKFNAKCKIFWNL